MSSANEIIYFYSLLRPNVLLNAPQSLFFFLEMRGQCLSGIFLL